MNLPPQITNKITKSMDINHSEKYILERLLSSYIKHGEETYLKNSDQPAMVADISIAKELIKKVQNLKSKAPYV